MAESDVLAKPYSPRDLCQSNTAHEAGTPLGEFALGQIGVLGIEHYCHRLAEDRVAEEFESFVVCNAAVLVRERAVRQCKLKVLSTDCDEKLFCEVACGWLYGARGAGVASAGSSSAEVNARHELPPSVLTTD